MNICILIPLHCHAIVDCFEVKAIEPSICFSTILFSRSLVVVIPEELVAVGTM